MKNKKLTKKEKELYKKFSEFCGKVAEVVEKKEFTYQEIADGLKDMQNFFIEKTKV